MRFCDGHSWQNRALLVFDRSHQDLRSMFALMPGRAVPSAATPAVRRRARGLWAFASGRIVCHGWSPWCSSGIGGR